MRISLRSFVEFWFGLVSAYRERDLQPPTIERDWTDGTT